MNKQEFIKKWESQLIAHNEKQPIDFKADLDQLLSNGDKVSGDIRSFIIDVIIKRCNDAFSDNCHNHEHQRLIDALHSIKELIPPNYFKLTPTNSKLPQTPEEWEVLFNQKFPTNSIDMEALAIEFAKWICKHGYDSKQIMVSPRWNNGYGRPEYTSEQLFEMFQKETHCLSDNNRSMEKGGVAND